MHTRNSHAIADTLAEVLAAERRLAPYDLGTPVRRSVVLSKRTGCNVWLKLENLQVTGAFKVRGALNKLIPHKGSGRHVVAASTGNHALAVAYASKVLDMECTLFLPRTAAPNKVAALRRFDARLESAGTDGVEAECAARKMAESAGHLFVSPYNDPAIIGGGGTVGLELLSQVDRLDGILIAVGGGGMISGIAAAVKAYSPQTRIIGCSPVASSVMHDSVRAGQILERASQPTLSDGTAGGIEVDAVTFPLCTSLVDDWLLVEEDEIAAAMLGLRADENLTVEGAAAVPLAALTKNANKYLGKSMAVVLCGGNVDWQEFETNRTVP